MWQAKGIEENVHNVVGGNYAESSKMNGGVRCEMCQVVGMS
jgi:hypothetical protein